MKPGIHPELHYIEVTCACGNKFHTHSTLPELRLEIVDQLAANEGFFRSGDEAVKAIEPDWAGCIAEIFETEPGIVPRIVGIIIDETGQQRLLVALVNEEDATATVLASVTIPECEIFETLP